MKLNHPGLSVAIMLCIGAIPLAHAQQTKEDQEWERLIEGDFEEKALQVNEGQLEFLSARPADKPIHTVTNTITISENSLKTHWVTLHQCHKNLDAVAESEIIYQYNHIRNLRIEHYYGMENAWIQDQSVQMKQIEKGASLCVLADVQILKPNKQGIFILRNGPYFRKFLDGYYPFHVHLNINYPKSSLSLKATNPKPQKGFDVTEDIGNLKMDAWFEGKLMVEAQFIQITSQ